jgi:hypothetical protein
MANFKPLNRYTNGIVTFTRNNQKFLVLRKSLDLEPDNSDVLVTITQDLARRPDLISFKAYGSPDYWWVIYEYNGIRDPVFDLKTGQIIKIPTMDRVNGAIAKLGVT